MESVSFGLRVVNSQEELKEAVDFIVQEFEQQALVEQFIRGREFGNLIRKELTPMGFSHEVIP